MADGTPRFDTTSGVRYVSAAFAQTAGVAWPASTTQSWFMANNATPTDSATVMVLRRYLGWATTRSSSVRAGVEHVVKITSKASADSPIARRRGQAEIENGLIASGLGYTLLRTNAYMQNFLMLAPAIAKTSSFGSSTGDGRIGLIDTRDVVDVAAEISASPARHAGKTYWPTRPEQLSYADAAAVLSNVLGRPIGFHPITFEEQRQAMIDAGLPETVAEDNAKALSLFAEGDADYITDDVPSLLGRPGCTFEQFPTDFAEAFW